MKGMPLDPWNPHFSLNIKLKNTKYEQNYSWALGSITGLIWKTSLQLFCPCFVLRPSNHASSMKDWSGLNGLSQKDNSLFWLKGERNSTFLRELCNLDGFWRWNEMEKFKKLALNLTSNFQKFSWWTWCCFDFLNKTWKMILLQSGTFLSEMREWKCRISWWFLVIQNAAQGLLFIGQEKWILNFEN